MAALQCRKFVLLRVRERKFLYDEKESLNVLTEIKMTH
jgi:hypothetical protein